MGGLLFEGAMADASHWRCWESEMRLPWPHSYDGNGMSGVGGCTPLPRLPKFDLTGLPGGVMGVADGLLVALEPERRGDELVACS